MSESSVQVVTRYLHEAVAAFKNFESQLRAFAEEATDSRRKNIFSDHAARMRNQYERISARLEILGSSPIAAKSLLDHLIHLTARPAASAHSESPTAENFVKTYALESSAIALYEAIANIAEAAGDTDTVALTRSLQQEAKSSAESIWQLLPIEAQQDLARANSATS